MTNPTLTFVGGLALIAFSVYGAVRGEIIGSTFSISREERADWFWIGIVVQGGLGIRFVLAAFGI